MRAYATFKAALSSGSIRFSAALISAGGTRMPAPAASGPDTSTASNFCVNSMTAASPSCRTRRTTSATAS